MHAWNFSQTFALTWIGEQSFRCIDPTHSLHISIHNLLVQVSVSWLPPVYARRQIIWLTLPLEQICVSINISSYWKKSKRKRQKARYWFISHIITNDEYKYIFIDGCIHIFVLGVFFSSYQGQTQMVKNRNSAHLKKNLDYYI